jgi:chaperonin cofactor prefoldin
MDEEEVLDELDEEVSGLQNELEATESSDDPRSVREKQERAQELVSEIQDQLEFLSKVADTEP